jgi:osmoprotectant transport system permease protein
MIRRINHAALALLCIWVFSCHSPEVVRIGSKEFTESVILGEMAAHLANTQHPKVKHMKALGGTRVLWDALVKGEIDLYPEYTGTLTQEIFSGKIADGSLAQKLAEYGIRMSDSIGFDNSYAIGMKESVAEHLKIKTISDLKNHPELRLGFSNEFMDRRDGWTALRKFYRLPQTSVRGLEHQLAYRALESKAINATDLYSTDADIQYYHLRILQDDRRFFPFYTAVFLYRADVETKAPAALQAVLRLQGSVPLSEMIALNARVKIEGISAEQAAADYIARRFSLPGNFERNSFLKRLALRSREHIFLVSISLLSAILISVPLGIVTFLHEKSGQVILTIVGAIQTIPSLALIVFMIPLLGIGDVPAIVALFLYSLLPIVRSTHAGLSNIPMAVRESAEALGLPRFACLRLVELPIASRLILSGIKTSAVINIGTATLGALIGAGGFGQPILTGIRLNNVGLLLEGAVPAALLAWLVQALFDWLEKLVVPKGLRIEARRQS